MADHSSGLACSLHCIHLLHMPDVICAIFSAMALALLLLLIFCPPSFCLQLCSVPKVHAIIEVGHPWHSCGFTCHIWWVYLSHMVGLLVTYVLPRPRGPLFISACPNNKIFPGLCMEGLLSSSKWHQTKVVRQRQLWLLQNCSLHCWSIGTLML